MASSVDSSGVRLRLGHSPHGGERVAYSYLGALVGLFVAGLIWAVLTPFGAIVCADPEDLGCRLGWSFGGGLVGVAVGELLPAIALRLGWEWWVALSSVALSAPLWSVWLSSAGAVAVVLLAPLAAALATLQGDDRPRWRPWVIGGAGLALVLGAVAVVLWA